MEFIKLPFIIYILTLVAFFVLLFTNISFFEPIQNSPNVYKTKIFLFTDVLFPFFASMCIIMRLGGIMEKKSFGFFCSLPTKFSPLMIWLFFIIFFLLMNSLCVITAFFKLKSFPVFQIAFESFYFLSLANMVLFCSVTLLIIFVFREIFYVCSIFYGYLLVDLVIGESLLGSRSIFVNLFGQCTAETIKYNRKILYIVSFICVIISLILFKFDFLRKMNRHLQ